MSRVFIRYPEARLREVFSFGVGGDTRRGVRHSRTDPSITIAQINDRERAIIEKEGAIVYEDVQFEHFPSDEFYGFDPSDLAVDKNANDVLEQIQAEAAWEFSTGKGVTVVVVDSGVKPRVEFNGRMLDLEIASDYAGNHWDDEIGHGTMCAAIACGKSGDGARYNGVAPGAALASARTNCSTTDIYDIYDQLIAMKVNGQIDGPVVVNNSYGAKVCVPQYNMPMDHPYVSQVKAAVAAGIVVVFAAGNCHCDFCNYDAQAHEKNSIWAANSLDEVISVGAVDWESSNTNPKRLHRNSSRGPGQWADQYKKPDCVAPCYGEVAFGDTYISAPWWGTSGAAPQVTGLAALVLAKDPTLKPSQVAELIRNTCVKTGGHECCVGNGVINCLNALKIL